MRNARAFTIVELSVVIVVIAILVAVTVVAYNSILDRSMSVQNASMAESLYEGLAVYKLENHAYPPSANGFLCFGKSKFDVNSDGLSDCSINSNNTVDTTEVTAFNTAIKPYANPNSTVANFQVISSGKKLSGASLWYVPTSLLDGVPHLRYISYIVKGDNKCEYGQLLSDAGFPNFSSTRPSSGYTYQNSGGRGCIIYLLD